jgi:hypothetical protein
MWTFHPTNKELFAHIKYDGTIMFTLHCEVTYEQGIAVANALNKVGIS